MADDDLKLLSISEEYVNEQADSPDTCTEDLFSQNGDGLPPLRESDERKLGLDIIRPWGWSGSSYSDYDVVTVHGIRDDYKTAWTEEDGTWWLKEKLFKNLSIREVDYSYEIDEEATIFQVDGIKLHAERLLTAYAKERAKLEDTEIDRPIMWICHDLGGTIVKEALCQAVNNTTKYGKIAILTTAIIFMGTPHRFQSMQDLEDQLHNLLLLPGPDIRYGFLSKVRNLASHVNRINQDFLATKLLDRAAIFNIFVQNWRDSLRKRRAEGDESIPEVEEYDIPDPVTPFSRYTHFIGQSFEAAGRIRINRIDHADLIRGDWDDRWMLEVSDLFNAAGCTIRVNYRLLQLQAHVLSLAPPTRSLDTPFDPLLPDSPVLSWIYKQESYIAFSKVGMGPRLMHLYSDGNSSVDIKEISRLLYIEYDANYALLNPGNSTIYFEFDQWDSRYNTISSMLIHFINTILWRFWDIFLTEYLQQELNFLSDTRSWSPEDLYHLYTKLRPRGPSNLTFFISGFDQCPEEQRRWFLECVLEEQSYSEAGYRLILSSSTRDGLAVENFPDAARINMGDCPAITSLNDQLSKKLGISLADLLVKRPIYRGFQQELEMLLRGCEHTPYLGHIILNWLGNYPRGRPKSEIATKINELSPMTAENITHAIVSSLAPELRVRAENVFNWVKHALEPWSTESLAEALAVFRFPDQEPCFVDLDAEGLMKEMEVSFCGIIIVKDNDVKFSHPSFYLVSELGVDGSDEERAAKVNSAMAEVCLRYLQLKNVQEAITAFSDENFQGNIWKTSLDAAVISHSRASMAEYAVRFWPRHYEASGLFKPKQLVFELFANKKARGCWETFLWLLSNPFTRPQRGYISTLPIFARLGLEDLIDENIKAKAGQFTFDKDCWFAITEAAQTGRSDTVRKLLQHVSMDEEELQTALYLGAGNGNADTLSALIDKIPRLGVFQWPGNLFHRASAIGLGDLLTFMLQSGYDVNEISSFYQAPPLTIAAWRGCISSMEILLNSKLKADLSIKDTSGETPLMSAARNGKPRVMEIILQALKDGGSIAEKGSDYELLIQLAVNNYRHRAVDILLSAGADFNTDEKVATSRNDLKSPLILAANLGALECARALLNYGADPLVSCATGTALYEAVANNNIEIARLLLEQEQKPDLDARPPGAEMLLMRAVDTRNAELVLMLIEYGIEVEFADPNGGAFCTPLSRACGKGNLDVVKLLLQNKANINYTGDISESPLFSAILNRNIEVATYLLQDERIDVHWSRDDGVNALNAAFASPEIVRELLKRGISIDHNSSWGTVLHIAAENYPKTIEVLLEHDPKPDLESVCGETVWPMSHIGCTPLQLACLYQAPECVKLLLNAGANAKFRNKNGMDAVDILLQTKNCSKNVEQCLRLILSEPDKIDADHVDTKGQTRLHTIKKKTPVEIIQLLLKAKVPLDRPDNDGYTPLAISIREGNTSVAKYLIDQGASINVFGPSFGSILHLAVNRGAVGLVKLLIDSGADYEAVDPKYGASLLYTALGIRNSSELQRMVKYLVDEVKVPINKLGGELGYPIIRAADITDYTDSLKMLKFLIRRKAQLDVTDSQGRRAVHFACAMWYAGGIKLLVEAGAEVDVKDMFGRMPIHFAASASSNNCIEYLLDMYKHVDINTADYDGWTPLLWAARSGNGSTITRLIAENADVWALGDAYGAGGQWSALKLMNFVNRNKALREKLKPKERTRINHKGEKEEWNDSLHNIRAGDRKSATCKSCLVDITGIEWKCVDCSDNFSFCFKCYRHIPDIHDSEHTFQEIEPLYEGGSASPSRRSAASHDGEQENLGDGEAKSAPDTDLENKELDAPENANEEEFDLDDFDLDADH
ncbi:putative ankyrin repeat protein [Trichoderma evansii]